MYKTIDLYLGIFLVLCGFGLSLLNLRSIISNQNRFSTILLSENVLLVCIGIAFLSRAVYSLNPANVQMDDVEFRIASVLDIGATAKCGFSSLLLSYGPLVVSLVNSFLSLIIDNYMHYRILKDIKKKEDDNTVQEIGENSRTERKGRINKVFEFGMKYFSYISIVLQWIVPIIIALFMYPVEVKEMTMSQMRSLDDSCMAMLDISDKECSNMTDNVIDWNNTTNITLELRKYISAPVNYLEILENEKPNTNSSSQINRILDNVFGIVNNFNNHTDFAFTNYTKSPRKPKNADQCVKICFVDNKSMLLYMFILAFVSFFVPITISTVILTKIHVMEVKRPNVKTYVTRELLYNVLFWSPVMFDTFLSLILCSFSMHSTKTSLFNVIANVYQAIKNFMNTKYFKENVIVPV